MRINLESSIKFIRGIQVILILGLIFVAYSMILPEEARIERGIEINASPDIVFNYYNDLALFNRWSPWFDSDPQATYTFSSPSYGVGASMRWNNANRSGSSGSQQIITSVPYKIVSSDLDLGKNGKGISSVTIYNNRDNTRCHVVWSFEARLDGVLQRYRGRFIDRLLGSDFEKGLLELKRIAETRTIPLQ